jgi:hypothetical protein
MWCWARSSRLLTFVENQVLSGAENAYGFGLSAALVVPMGSAGEAGW